MQTFNPTANKPAFMKAIEATNKLVEARNVSAKLSLLPEVEATMSALTGHDDLRIKTAKTSMVAYNKLINEFLYSKAKFDGIEFTGFEDFESKLMPADKEILVALLLDATYTKLPKRSAYCPKCNEMTEYELRVSDLFNNPESKIPVWDQEVPVYEKVFEEVVYDKILKVGIKMPSEARKTEIYNIMSFDNMRKNIVEKGSVIDSTDAISMFVDYIQIEIPSDEENGKTETLVLRNLVAEIKPYLDNAPLEIHDAIDQFINKTFDKYIIDLKAPVTCNNCGENFNWSVSPESEFFRKAFSI